MGSEHDSCCCLAPVCRAHLENCIFRILQTKSSTHQLLQWWPQVLSTTGKSACHSKKFIYTLRYQFHLDRLNWDRKTRYHSKSWKLVNKIKDLTVTAGFVYTMKIVWKSVGCSRTPPHPSFSSSLTRWVEFSRLCWGDAGDVLLLLTTIKEVKHLADWITRYPQIFVFSITLQLFTPDIWKKNMVGNLGIQVVEQFLTVSEIQNWTRDRVGSWMPSSAVANSGTVARSGQKFLVWCESHCEMQMIRNLINLQLLDQESGPGPICLEPVSWLSHWTHRFKTYFIHFMASLGWRLMTSWHDFDFKTSKWNFWMKSKSTAWRKKLSVKITARHKPSISTRE